MNSETSQNSASNCSFDACEESSADPSAPETLAKASSEPEATLVIQLGYRGTAFCGFAEQPTQRTVAGDLRFRPFCAERLSSPAQAEPTPA